MTPKPVFNPDSPYFSQKPVPGAYFREKWPIWIFESCTPSEIAFDYETGGYGGFAIFQVFFIRFKAKNPLFWPPKPLKMAPKTPKNGPKNP